MTIPTRFGTGRNAGPAAHANLNGNMVIVIASAETWRRCRTVD